jgi:hypothetical protein
VVPGTGRLAFFCREVDAPSAWLTANLEEDQVFGYPERYVQRADVHPMDWVAATIRPWWGSPAGMLSMRRRATKPSSPVQQALPNSRRLHDDSFHASWRNNAG